MPKTPTPFTLDAELVLERKSTASTSGVAGSMPDDILTSRQHNVLASYWRQYDACESGDEREPLLRSLIERGAFHYGYAACLRDLQEFHNERREEDANAERRRG